MCMYSCVKVYICGNQMDNLRSWSSPFHRTWLPRSKPVLTLQVPYSVIFFFSLFLKQGLYVAQASLRNTSQPFFLQVPGYWDCRLAPSRFHILIKKKKVWTKLLKLFQIFASSTKIQNKLGVLVQILRTWSGKNTILCYFVTPCLKRRGGDCHSGFFQMQC